MAELNTVIIGASADALAEQSKFCEKESLKFAMLADPDLKLIKSCGVLREGGKFANRWTFVINKEGKIAKIYDKVQPASHPKEVYEFIKENLEKQKSS